MTDPTLDRALDLLAKQHVAELLASARARLRVRCPGCLDCLAPDILAGLEDQPWWKPPAQPCGQGRAA